MAIGDMITGAILLMAVAFPATIAAPAPAAAKKTLDGSFTFTFSNFTNNPNLKHCGVNPETITFDNATLGCHTLPDKYNAFKPDHVDDSIGENCIKFFAGSECKGRSQLYVFDSLNFVGDACLVSD